MKTQYWPSEASGHNNANSIVGHFAIHSRGCC